MVCLHIQPQLRRPHLKTIKTKAEPKHLLEDLEAPSCPTCGIEMQWHRSELFRFVPVTNLHLFNCPICFLLAEFETVDIATYNTHVC